MIDSLVNQIYCGDCVEVLAYFPDDCIDLIITSPPYDSIRDYNGFVFNFPLISREMYRVLQSGGVVVWVVNDETLKGSESLSSFKQAIYFVEDCGFKLHDTMIWQKTGVNFPSKGRYTQIFEYMFIFSKGKPKTFNPICDVPKLWEGSWGKLKTRNRDGSLTDRNLENEGKARSGRDDTGLYGYKQRFNIWNIVNGRNFSTRDSVAYEHPAIFPEKLAEDHIISWSNEGDVVLDPMCGSGTVCKMAKMLNRKYIGIDVSEEYCEIARKRVNFGGNPSVISGNALTKGYPTK